MYLSPETFQDATVSQMSNAQANQNLADSLKVPATPDTPFFNKYDNAPETPGFT